MQELGSGVLHEAEQRGREAFFAGVPAAECPFEAGSPSAVAWCGAFEAARDYRVWLDSQLEREA